MGTDRNQWKAQQLLMKEREKKERQQAKALAKAQRKAQRAAQQNAPHHAQPDAPQSSQPGSNEKGAASVATKQKQRQLTKEEKQLEAMRVGRVEQLQQRLSLVERQQAKLVRRQNNLSKKQDQVRSAQASLERQQQTLELAISEGGGAPRHRVDIPVYRLSEELLAAISHGAGALLGVVALVLCVMAATRMGSPIAVVSAAIYGASLILLYTVSTIYHALAINGGKRVFRVLDHCTIYLLIAGTYTPYTLVALHGTIGWVLFGVVWASAVAGIVFSAIDLHRFRKLAMIAYLGMGWVIVFAMKPLFASVASPGIWLLFLGGVAYTIGACMYGLGKKIPYMHAVFHFFVLAGSILHFFSLYQYVFV